MVNSPKKLVLALGDEWLVLRESSLNLSLRLKGLRSKRLRLERNFSSQTFTVKRYCNRNDLEFFGFYFFTTVHVWWELKFDNHLMNIVFCYVFRRFRKNSFSISACFETRSNNCATLFETWRVAISIDILSSGIDSSFEFVICIMANRGPGDETGKIWEFLGT